MVIFEKIRLMLSPCGGVVFAVFAMVALLAAGCHTGSSLTNLPLTNLPQEYGTVVLAPVRLNGGAGVLLPERAAGLKLAAGEGFANGIRAKGYTVVIADANLSAQFLKKQPLPADETRTRYAVLKGDSVTATFDRPETFAATETALEAFGSISVSAAAERANSPFDNNTRGVSGSSATFNISFRSRKSGTDWDTSGSGEERGYFGAVESFEPETFAHYATEVVANLPPAKP